MSHEWQGPIKPNKEEIVPVENPAAEKPPKAEDKTTIEKELSPEVVKMIMDKVEAIDNLNPDTVFHAMRAAEIDPCDYSGKTDLESKTIIKNDLIKLHNTFKNVMKDGLIGQTTNKVKNKQVGENFSSYTITKQSAFNVKKNYINHLKAGNTLMVHANQLLYKKDSSLAKDWWKIMSKSERKVAFKLSMSDYVNSFYDKEHVVVLFDASKFQKDSEENFIGPSKKTTKEKGIDYGSSEYGNLFHPRISNKFFKGIVFGYVDLSFANEMKNTEMKYFYENKGIEEYARVRNKTPKEIADEYIEIMLKTLKGKPKLLVPIYDIGGNLWWPKKMSYEEVKKFVADRDEKKMQNTETKD